MALWAHRASEVIFPLLLASLSTPPGGSHRWGATLMRGMPRRARVCVQR
jgi:hypothetical protein